MAHKTNRRLFFAAIASTVATSASAVELVKTQPTKPQPHGIMTVEELLATDLHPHTPEEAKEAEEFFEGKQWDPEIEERRARDGRPCITVNRVHGMRMTVLAADDCGKLPAWKFERLTVVMYRRSREPQRIYNYLYSEFLEQSVKVPAIIGNLQMPRKDFSLVEPPDLRPIVERMEIADLHLRRAMGVTR